MVSNGPLYPRIQREPDGSFFLFGPRGVGKSTWARERFAGAHWVDLLDEARFNELSADPGLFADELRTIAHDRPVVVDEVQRIPNLLNEVHRFIESRGMRFVLLGSSARKLKTAGTNLLAGRALLREMFPLVPEELGADFDLDEVLSAGSLPVVWTSPDRRGALEAYVRLYLREEIRAEALVRNLPGFLRFLPVASLFHGRVVNVSGIARDAAVSRTTVAGYLEILEDTLLSTRLPAYEARLRVRERRHPKLYWTDSGVVRAVKMQFGPAAAEERGSLFEGLVLMLLRAYAQNLPLYDAIHYWATAQGGVEVDFLLRRGRDFLAIEVKSQNRFSPRLTTGLRAIGELDGVVRRVLVYTGRRVLRTQDRIDVWPFEHFSEALRTDALWP